MGCASTRPRESRFCTDHNNLVFGTLSLTLTRTRTGEDDIDSILADLQKREATKAVITVESGVAPSPRMAASLTAHPSADALVLFGGEFMGTFFNRQYTFPSRSFLDLCISSHCTPARADQRQHVYNDLYLYDIAKRAWSRVTSPNAPPPRSSHQAVAIDREGGLIYIFGAHWGAVSIR